MKRRYVISLASIGALFCGCAHKAGVEPLHAKSFGTAIVESSGGKQLGNPGTPLGQPFVVQVNDKQGNAVTGALVSFSGAAGAAFNPQQALTDSSGQVSTEVTLGGISGRYEITATSFDGSGKQFVLNVTEFAAGYQQQLGFELDQRYCARCHDSESTPQRVSNYDNLAVKPHGFTEGEVLNKLSEADLTAIIGHGGPALNRSVLMPPFGATLNKSEVESLIAYIRLVSDPPFQSAGVVYAKH